MKSFFSHSKIFFCLLIMVCLHMEIRATGFSGGQGTVADPYRLSFKNDFFDLSDSVKGGKDYAGKYFIITDNIDFANENFIPIGNNFDGSSALHYFNGKVDGLNHQIYHFRCVISDMGLGLFGLIGVGSEIKNIHMVSGEISGSSLIGSIVGYNGGGNIIHCSAGPDVSVKATAFYAGGISGSLSENCTISQCVSYATVSISGNNGMNAGGIVGGCNGRVIECCNFGNVSIKHSYAGGIVGYSDKTCYISDCYNSGIIRADVGYAGGMAGGLMISGNSAGNEIKDCYNYGRIQGPNNRAICAMQNSMSISNCYFESSLSQCSDPAATAKTATEMNNPAFVSNLNSDVNDTTWTEDLNLINLSYPILNWQKNQLSVIGENVQEELCNIFTDGNSIVVSSVKSLKSDLFNVAIFDIKGALLASKSMTNGRAVIRVGVPGIYFVCISGIQYKQVRKVAISK